MSDNPCNHPRDGRPTALYRLHRLMEHACEPDFFHGVPRIPGVDPGIDRARDHVVLDHPSDSVPRVTLEADGTVRTDKTTISGDDVAGFEAFTATIPEPTFLERTRERRGKWVAALLVILVFALPFVGAVDCRVFPPNPAHYAQ